MEQKHDGDDEDFEFDFDSPRRKPVVRRGRRSDGNLSSTISSSHVGDGSPIKGASHELSAKSGGWAEDFQSSKMSWLRRVSRPGLSKGTPTKETKTVPESDNAIPTIPDLSEMYEEDLSTQIADAPNIAVHRVMTYQELDSDLVKNAAFQILDGVDLRLLTKHLEPENEVQEEDFVWTWDMLFTDAASKQSEMWKQVDLKAGILATGDIKDLNDN